LKLEHTLKLRRCPHCNIDNPNLAKNTEFTTTNSEGRASRRWAIYACQGCGGVVTAWADHPGGEVQQLFPQIVGVHDAIPDRARSYLKQAIESIHAPSGAVMLAASAVDAMLKHKSYVDDSLYTRIDKAAKDHVITEDMAKWAHEVRLDANEQRHSDTDVTLPDTSDAERCVAFAKALGEFMFVLPARVTRGREEAKKPAS
jgi:hypothetical protein